MEINLNVADFTDDITKIKQDKSELIPEGWYPATVEQGYEEISKAGDRQLVIVFALDNGRKLWNRYLVHYPKEDIKKTNEARLMRLAGSCGLVRLGQAGELVDRKCEIKVIIKGEWNNVEDSRSIDRSPAPTNGSAPQKVNPWGKTEEAAVDEDEPSW